MQKGAVSKILLMNFSVNFEHLTPDMYICMYVYTHNQLAQNSKIRQTWTHTLVISALERLRQEDCQELEVNLDYTLSNSQPKLQNTTLSQKHKVGEEAGKMAQKFKSTGSSFRGPGSIPQHTHSSLTIVSNSSSKEQDALFWPPEATGMHVVHRQERQPYTQ